MNSTYSKSWSCGAAGSKVALWRCGTPTRGLECAMRAPYALAEGHVGLLTSDSAHDPANQCLTQHLEELVLSAKGKRRGKGAVCIVRGNGRGRRWSFVGNPDDSGHQQRPESGKAVRIRESPSTTRSNRSKHSTTTTFHTITGIHKPRPGWPSQLFPRARGFSGLAAFPTIISAQRPKLGPALTAAEH